MESPLSESLNRNNRRWLPVNFEKTDMRHSDVGTVLSVSSSFSLLSHVCGCRGPSFVCPIAWFDAGGTA